MSAEPEAWAQYWREAAATGSGCAPASPGIAAACEGIWREFAAALPARAAVLDLATGNGAVLLHLRSERPEAALVGVDSAPDLGRGDGGGNRLMAGVTMERLPFEAKSFDAVTSQFGFEYGTIREIAAEIARVLRPDGRVRLLVHHSASPVVRQGHARREELRWALKPGSPLEQGARFAAARGAMPLPIPPALRAAPAQAASLFAAPSVAAEIMTGMLQMLELGGANAPALLGQLRVKVAAELARLDALIAAACDDNAIARIGTELASAGLQVNPVRRARVAGAGVVFGWLLDALAP